METTNPQDPEKSGINIIYIALAIFVFTTVVFGLMYRDCRKKSTYDPFQDELTKSEIKALQKQRDSIQNLYDKEIQKAIKAASGIKQSRTKQATNKQQYEKELSDWNALPDSALLQRTNFFRGQLSQVDTLPKW